MSRENRNGHDRRPVPCTEDEPILVGPPLPRPPDDHGVGILVGEATSLKMAKPSRSYVAMIRGLAEQLLSPEEQLELAEALPKVLSAEARARLADAAKAAG